MVGFMAVAGSRGARGAAMSGCPEGWPQGAKPRSVAVLGVVIPIEAAEIVIGMILAGIDTARNMTPPPTMTTRGALDSLAGAMQDSAREIFGAALWSMVVTDIRLRAMAEEAGA